MTERLDVCSGCFIAELDLAGCRPTVVNEIVGNLFGDPKQLDGQGYAKPHTAAELEDLRQYEVVEWAEYEDIGAEASRVLQEHPELVVAAYQCERARALGECTYQEDKEK